MSKKQPEALRLATLVENFPITFSDAAAAELRRLYAELRWHQQAVVSLREQLRTYQEREQTMGWNQE